MPTESIVVMKRPTCETVPQLLVEATAPQLLTELILVMRLPRRETVPSGLIRG